MRRLLDSGLAPSLPLQGTITASGGPTPSSARDGMVLTGTEALRAVGIRPRLTCSPRKGWRSVKQGPPCCPALKGDRVLQHERARNGVGDHVRHVLRGGAATGGDGNQGLVHHVLLEGSHPIGQVLFLSHGPHVELVDHVELHRGELGQVPLPRPAQMLLQLDLELGAGAGVEESDAHGGPAAGEPREGSSRGSCTKLTGQNGEVASSSESLNRWAA
ncbi:hypothetical protein H6P81_014012 [Aristolochia fimbriata]|uniref:Uncharacterized protein n=1 Tax=Aristolochia fimbriata TaxID=158543 RepID=A0AAV7EGR1_ARIFI|nr:hypothetical protein H6P81_014012 [Aristolochia fimbriata]